jgi:hypothetical protein
MNLEKIKKNKQIDLRNSMMTLINEIGTQKKYLIQKQMKE